MSTEQCCSRKLRNLQQSKGNLNSRTLSVASATLETLYGTALDNKILVGKEELDMIGRQKGTVVDFKSLNVPSKDDEEKSIS
mmetsp:Transcript_39139/g.42403  ORF Transcript_39139/g.42403 Transcript_39139/m.42403 type:complete len:82 (-) Transcript_39139:1157-1402(-)